MSGTGISTACEHFPRVVVLVDSPVRMVEGRGSGVPFRSKCSGKKVHIELANHFVLKGYHVAGVDCLVPCLPVQFGHGNHHITPRAVFGTIALIDLAQ